MPPEPTLMPLPTSRPKLTTAAFTGPIARAVANPPVRTWLGATKLALSALISAGLIGCGDPKTSQEEPQSSLSIGAATSLKPVMVELLADFKKQSGVEVGASFASSGALFAQISQGAPFELFLSADAQRPQALFAAGLSQEPVTYAIGELLLASTKEPVCQLLSDAQPALNGVTQLNTLAMANPVVAPYGAAAASVLSSAYPGRFDARLNLIKAPEDIPAKPLEQARSSSKSANPNPNQSASTQGVNNPELPPPGQNQNLSKPNQLNELAGNDSDPATQPINQSDAELTQPTLLTAQNAAQTFGLILSKNADAGLIAASDWKLYSQSAQADGCAFEVQANLYPAIRHQLTLINKSADSPSKSTQTAGNSRAEKLAAYLVSPSAQAILSRYGFSSPQ